MRHLTLLELNEANIDLIEKYIAKGVALPNFHKLISNGVKKSSSENEYELIEPWIQWPSVHSGLSADEHKIFRLGDIVSYNGEQIFEKLESRGWRVGCISPMNASNKMRNPSFFIPDPWTMSSTDGGWKSAAIHDAITRAVNENTSNKLDKLSLFKMAIAIALTISPTQLMSLMLKLPKLKSQGYKRAIFLDCMLTELYLALARKKKVNFGVLFLNGIAHIQHHYLHSSLENANSNLNPNWYVTGDPVAFALKYYDDLLGRVSKLNGFETIVATGLSQILFEKPVFYYRLKNHRSFLKSLGIKYTDIFPRMTRDFLVKFENNVDRDRAYKTLSLLDIEQTRVFGLIEKREKELFVTLDYPLEISSTDAIINPSNNIPITLLEEVNFVALKNGHHSGTGYVLASDWGSLDFMEGAHISKLHETILKFFRSEEKVKSYIE